MKRIFAGALAVLVMATSGGPASAQSGQETAAPPSFKQYPNIIEFDAFKAYAAIPRRDDVLIVDSRPARKFHKGHVPVAINISQSQFDRHVEKLPAEKSTTLIFYCGGVRCPLSHKSARQAEALGYTDIRVYAGGYPDWMAHDQFAGVSVSYVKKILAKGKAVVVDARPPRKFNKGHIPGAINIPATRFAAMREQLPADKNTRLVFYCGGYKCPLSAKAAYRAKALGYTNIRLFQAGYPEWKTVYGKVTQQEPVRE